MKYDFLIFGAGGIQGKIVTRDLIEKKYNVFVSDLKKEDLDCLLKKYPSLSYECMDLSDLKKIIELVKKIKPSVVINCAEGDWNLNVYKACLEGEAHVIDLGSDIPMTREQFALSDDFKKKNLTAITGCGSTPGVNNIMLDYAVNFFDSVETVEAGFAWDSNIKEFVIPFSMNSIVEEFTEPAPIVRNGRWIKKEPLTTIVEKKFRKIGKQKCFFVRHPETFTFYHYYKNKGLKNVKFYAGFPNHSFDTICNFINLGLGEKEEIKLDGRGVVPIDVLNEVLKKINQPSGYSEKENLWVETIGQKEGKEKKVLMECIVHTLPGWEEAGCNIDTGIPASIIAQMIRNEKITGRGSFAPESVVPKEEFFKSLKEKEMAVYMNGRAIN
jgi:saccharopine dehydrogenase-like NADP-dependent oxidoreductase